MGNRWGAAALSLAAGIFSVFLARREREGRAPAVIRSAPPGASVFLDGSFLGTTPLTAVLAPGAHALRLERDGFRTLEDSVSAGERRTFELTRIIYARLRVESEPWGADVRLNGTFRGRTPLLIEKVAPGRHVLIVEKANREPWKTELSLSPREDGLVEAALRDRVLEFLQAAVRSEPDDVLAWSDYAHYLFLQRDFDGAVEAYKGGLIAAYKPSANKNVRKRIEREIAKHYKWKGQRWPEFQRAMERAKKELSSRYRDNPVLLRERARELGRKGRRAEALELLEKAAAKWRDADTWLEAGRLSLQLGHDEESLRAFRRAVDAAPGDYRVRQRAAQSCRAYSARLADRRKQGEVLGFAEKILLQGIERAREREMKAVLLQELGELYRHQKRLDRAVERMQQAVEFSEGDEAAKRALRLAGYLRTLGRKELARRYYRVVIEKTQDPVKRRAAEKELDRLRR